MRLNKLMPGDMNNTQIEDKFWKKYTSLVTKEIIPYQWRVLHDDEPGAALSHCIKNFEIAAGERDGEFYGEVFQDTDVAKWLETVAYSLSYEKNPDLERQADEVIELLERAQQPDGYLDTYFIIKAPKSKFRNLQQGHELYTAGHMMEAAVAYYQITGKKKFLKIMEKNADLICEIFQSEEFKNAIPGHEEIEIGLFRMYQATGKKKYLEMAKTFIDRRGVCPEYFAQERKHSDWIEIYKDMKPDDTVYSQCHQPVREQREAVGHAVRAVYLYEAMADVSAECEDTTLLRACENLYDNIVKRRMYITGGIGSSGFLERFTTDYDLPNASNYAESCASVGLAFFTRKMAEITKNGKYIDTMELALMNTVLAGIAMDGKSFFYVNPLEVWPENCLENTSMSHVKPIRQKWFYCACCPTNIARTLASLANFIWFFDEKSIWINLFADCRLESKINDVDVVIDMKTQMPFIGRTTINVVCAEKVKGSIALRIPSYAENVKIVVDGECKEAKIEKGYWVLESEFDKNQIELFFDMPAQFVYANPNVRANNGKVAIKKGPLVYCAEEIDNQKNLSEIIIDTKSKIIEKYEKDLLKGTMTLSCKGLTRITDKWDMKQLYDTKMPEYKEITVKYVPYCYWGNRDHGEMQVWSNHLLHI